MKTPAKKATKAAAKAPAKVSTLSRKTSAKPAPVKGKPASTKVKAAPAKPKATSAKAKPVPSKTRLAPAKAKGASAKAKVAPAKARPAPSKTKAVPAKAKPVAKAKAPARSGPVPSRSAAAKAKSPVKSPAKAPVAKKVAAKARPAAKPASKAAPSARKTILQSKPAQPAVPTPRVAATVPTAAAVQPPAASDLPMRSSRPSARLAQITVPSMPQAVASTAAKASFLPQMTTALQPAPSAVTPKDPKLANNWKKKTPEQLTDAEVLAMPDSEYMNDVQMAFFRLKLVQLKQGILNNAGETTEHLREDTVVVPDPADRATIEEEHALELRTRDRERKLLKKIEQSIARIDAGDYGYCDETGEPIGVGRLLARPTATLSLEAQQRRELKQKMFGD